MVKLLGPTPSATQDAATVDSVLTSLYGPLVTRTLPYTNGGLGGTVTTSLSASTAGSVRFSVKLPVDASQWRIKIRNRDTAETAKTAATLKKLIVGLHSLPTTDATGADSGSFTGSTATTIVSTDQTIPGDGSYYTSPWVTTAGAVFTANTEFLVAFGWTFASSTAVQTGAGKAWYWANSTSATDPTIAGSGGTVTSVPFEYVIEYQSTTRRKVCLVIGDSIFEPIAGPKGTTVASITPTPLHRGNVYLWAAQHNRLIVNMSLAGFKLSDYALDPASVAGAAHLWNRLSLDTYALDEVLICGGSNDIFGNNATLAALQSSINTILSRLRTTYGFTGSVYLGTVLSRGTTNDAVRLSYNDWMGQGPSFVSAVVDFAGAMRGTSGTALWPDYTTDTIHPSWLGHRRMAVELAATLP